MGDRISIDVAVSADLRVSCSEPAAVVDAIVRTVGERFAILEDEGNPTFFPPAELAALQVEFDDVVFPVDSAYFGAPFDIDGNERVLLLFTREVNELTPPGSGAFIGGFFVPTDLASDGEPGGGGFDGDGVCSTSNEAELLYVLAPDEDGETGNAVDLEAARRNARTVASHEFQHLISAERRIFARGGVFDDLEDTWLAEGLAHLAEEIVGLRSAGLQERANLAEAAFADVEAFNAFHIGNFARLRLHFRAPNGTVALSLIDPGGFESLEMRGFAWLFARWLGDHFGPAAPAGPLGGSGEDALFRELSDGGAGRLRGVANVVRAIEAAGGGARTWPGLLGEFAIVAAVDDAGTPGVPATSTLPTWNLREVFRELHENPGSGPSFPEEYPLAIIERDFAPAAFDFDLVASTEAYFQLRDGAGPSLALELVSPSGGPVPPAASPQVTVVRTR